MRVNRAVGSELWETRHQRIKNKQMKKKSPPHTQFHHGQLHLRQFACDGTVERRTTETDALTVTMETKGRKLYLQRRYS